MARYSHPRSKTWCCSSARNLMMIKEDINYQREWKRHRSRVCRWCDQVRPSHISPLNIPLYSIDVRDINAHIKLQNLLIAQLRGRHCKSNRQHIQCKKIFHVLRVILSGEFFQLWLQIYALSTPGCHPGQRNSAIAPRQHSTRINTLSRSRLTSIHYVWSEVVEYPSR